MASDNKNTNRLARNKSNDDSGRLEVLSVDLIPTDEELEMDLDTFALEDADDEGNGDSEATLRSDLRSKDERISSLQYDIEQLRSRWSGLEKEIEARQELTQMLQADLRAAHKSMAAKDRKIDALKREIDSAASYTAADSGSTAQSAIEQELELLRERADDDTKRIAALEAELDSAIAASKSVDQPAPTSTEATDGALELEDLTRKYDDRGDELAKNRRMLERADSELRELRAERGRLDAMLKVARTENVDLKSNLKKARSELSEYRQTQLPDNERLMAEQRGALVNYADRASRLETRLAQSEAYANELREKLADAGEIRDASQMHAANLEKSLSSMTARAEKLDRQLGAARDDIEAVQASSAEEKRRFDEELSSVRHELDQALQTLSTQKTANDELAADLRDAIEVRQSLEHKLEEIEQEQARRIEKLRERTDALTADLEEAEKKITNKDNAITALLNELASKSKSIESIDEIESAIQDLDGRMSERIEAHADPDRDRPTRVLTGHIDGQEIRFPLFKDRLTIGRTAQNDIQLRAQYVSRRHAVLLVDEEGTKIVDWGSKNGVYVNKARISERALNTGDAITIGAAEFVYEERPRRDTT